MLGSGALALGILVGILFFNPYDLFTKRSDSFSFDRFDELTTGQSIEEAIELLGEPIAIKSKILKFVNHASSTSLWETTPAGCSVAPSVGSLLTQRVK